MLESLANTVMSRIKDVLYANSLAETSKDHSEDPTPSPTFSSVADATTPVTLSDFMGWDSEPSETGAWESQLAGNLKTYTKDEEEKLIRELASIKKFSYIDKVEIGGFRSPARG